MTYIHVQSDIWADLQCVHVHVHPTFRRVCFHLILPTLYCCTWHAHVNVPRIYTGAPHTDTHVQARAHAQIHACAHKGAVNIPVALFDNEDVLNDTLAALPTNKTLMFYCTYVCTRDDMMGT